MTITKNSAGTVITLAISGRLDTNTAPELDEELKKSLPGNEKLIFDFKELEYISSAGLRVLLSAKKQMNKPGSVIVRGMNETVSEVFEITGFSDLFDIE